jgi:leader peptidase (prepilin peptidase) / N-methyltransferase
METIAQFFVVAFGLILGSFFNVLIWRLPRGESIAWPGSHCPQCNRPIRAWENIPVVSYLLLRGKCAGCKLKISPVYPVVELGTAALALLLWHTLGTTRSLDWCHDLHLALQAIVLLLMLPITVIDLRHYIIPDAISLPFIIIGVAASFLPGDTTPLQSLLGLLAGGGVLYGIGWLGKIIFRKGEAMGGGDIKLLAFAGAFWGAKIALLTLLFASFLGTLGAIPFFLTKKTKTDHRIPFGPFLALGLWIAVLTGDNVVSWYMKFATGLAYH